MRFLTRKGLAAAGVAIKEVPPQNSVAALFAGRGAPPEDDSAQ